MRQLKREQGASLLEVVAALGFAMAVVVIFVSALTTHSMATRSADANDQALHLVRTQLELIRNAPYQASYDSLKLTPPQEYNLTITVVEEATNLQRITVTVSRQGKTYLSVEMYKAKLE